MYYWCTGTYITIVERKIKYAYEAGVQYRCKGGGFVYGGGTVMEFTVVLMLIAPVRNTVQYVIHIANIGHRILDFSKDLKDIFFTAM
jgi:hypothetical protein